jgi:hypothetical protein
MKHYPSKEELDSLPGFGKDGWIKYRFNRSFDNPYPESEMDAYLCPSGPSTILSVEQASDNNAMDIYETYGKQGPLFVAMSGGIDSEWVAKTLHRNKIPFTPIIYQCQDLHSLDTWWAYKWCRENGYEPVQYTDLIGEFADRLIRVARENCTRLTGGPAAILPCREYAESRGGFLLTGAGFFEFFPDDNSDYMWSRYKDTKLVDDEGIAHEHCWIISECEFTHARWTAPGHPWNFMSWTPESFLAYVNARQVGRNSEWNKAKIFGCSPRPKIAGAHDFFWRTNPLVAKYIMLKNNLGCSEVDNLGTTEEIIARLTGTL